MFDLERETPSFIQALYCLVYYLLFFALCYNDYYTCKWVRTTYTPKLSIPIIVLFFIFTLTYFVDTDYFHYYTYLKKYSSGDNIITTEPIYKIIAHISHYNYFFFRTFIWGSATLVVYCTAKKANIKPDFVLYILFILYFGLFAYARASLAMSILFLGFYYWKQPNKKIYLRWAGIIIMCLSMVFHSSLIIGLICCFIAPIFKWNKRRIIIYIMLIPLISLMIKAILNLIINSGTTEALLINKLIFYSESEVSVERTLLGKIQNSLEILSFVCPLFFIIYRVYFNNPIKNNIYISLELDYFKVSFFLISISFAFLNIGLMTEVFSYRIRYMAMIPIALSLAGLLQNGIVKKRDVQVCLIIGLINTSMGLASAVNHA